MRSDFVAIPEKASQSYKGPGAWVKEVSAYEMFWRAL